MRGGKPAWEAVCSLPCKVPSTAEPSRLRGSIVKRQKAGQAHLWATHSDLTGNMNANSTIIEPTSDRVYETPHVASLLGMGTAVPKYSVGQKVGALFAEQMSCTTPEQARKVHALYRRTGIEFRGSVLLNENPLSEIVNDFYPPLSSPEDRGPGTAERGFRYGCEAPVLAVEASRNAIRHSGIASKSITHLVTVSCTGFGAPGIDIELIDQLRLPRTTQRVHVGFMGCHGAINGLRVASGLVAANPNAIVLMCSVELCSLHYQYGFDPDRIVSGALFADGAASAVLHRGSAGNSNDSNAPSDSIGCVVATGSYLVPKSRDEMTWLIGDYGYEMTLSAKVPGLIEQHLSSFLEPWLAVHGESIESIQGWAVHPGGSRILRSVESSLALHADALDVSRAVLSDHGNMSSATMLFILQKFASEERRKPWLMLGFGPGLEIEVALIR